MTTMIQINNLKKSFGERDILKGVDLEIKKGEILFLLGGSGCGKSTIFKHLMGIYQADSGELLFEGENMVGLSERELDKFRSRMGVLFQSSALLKSLTVEQNIALPLREINQLPDDQVREKVLHALESVYLKPDILDLKPDQISGGMQKRVGLARAIIRNPDVILYDEPTTGLDPVIALGIHELIDSVNKEYHATSIVVSHDIPGAFMIADRMAIVLDGQIGFVGTPDEVRNHPDERIQTFLKAGMPQGFETHRGDNHA